MNAEDVPSILCIAAGFNLLLWALIGALIGWLLVAVLADRRRLCPECRAPVPWDATKCRHCGSDLQPGPGPKIEPGATQGVARGRAGGGHVPALPLPGDQDHGDGATGAHVPTVR